MNECIRVDEGINERERKLEKRRKVWKWINEKNGKNERENEQIRKWKWPVLRAASAIGHSSCPGKGALATAAHGSVLPSSSHFACISCMNNT